MTGVIDMINNGGQFTPTLIYRTTNGIFSRIGDIVQLNTAYIFIFTSSTQYITNANIIIYFPQSAIFPLATSSIICMNSGNITSCSYIANADNSISQISISICQNGCNSGTVFNITIENIKNPITIIPITGSFSITSYYNNYVIENINFTNNLQSLQTNNISNISVIRSSDTVSASISLTLSFQISSFIPTNGLIYVAFPTNFMILDSTLSIYSATPLTFTGSVNSITISNYCAVGCTSNSVISIVIKGIKNISSVQSIIGIMTITTSYSANIDYVSIDVGSILSPITPGTLYNVDIHPNDPTVSVITSYRIIFTTQHSIPSGSSITISLPSGVVISSSMTCTPYLTIESTLACTTANNTIIITNGFTVDYIGSYMIGIIISYIRNPGSPISYSPVQIILKDNNGYIIDQYLTAPVQYFLQATSCNCSQCSGNSCWECLVPSADPFLEGYSCVDTCSPGYFLVTILKYTCIQCYYTCAECTSQLASACTKCAPGLFKSDGYCVASCPNGTTSINNICTNLNACTSPCSTCSTSTTYCVQCASGSLLPGTGICEATCPSGYYLSGSLCLKCNEKCSNCSTISTNCTSCYNYYLDQYFYNNSCISTCPQGITVLTNGICVSCDSTCNTCLAI